MAKQGEIRLESERETWKIPYYDLGDVSTNPDRYHIRIGENGNVYEVASFRAELCSHPRIPAGYSWLTAPSLNNDTVPTVYDSLFFINNGVIWQNIKKKRDGSSIFYNRLQQDTRGLDEYIYATKWMSPWVIVGLGDKDGEPAYFVHTPTHSDDYYVEEGDSTAGGGDTGYDMEFSQSTATIIEGREDYTTEEYRLRLYETAALENSSTNIWENTTSYLPGKVSMGRANDYQLYEEVTLQHDTWVSLNNSNIATNSEAVDRKLYYSGSYIPEGFDQGSPVNRYTRDNYDMDYANGKIKALSSGNVPDGDTCYIHYEYGNEYKVYTVDTDNDTLIQLTASGGNQDWSQSFGSSIDALEGGSSGVYFALSGEQQIRKRDRNGNQAWTIGTTDAYPRRIILDNNQNYLYYSGFYGYLGRIDLSTNSQDWEVAFSDDIINFSIDYNDDYLYACPGSQTHEVDPSNGSIIRTYDKGGIEYSIPPAGDTGAPFDFINNL